jgi:hypothetical protein
MEHTCPRRVGSRRGSRRRPTTRAATPTAQSWRRPAGPRPGGRRRPLPPPSARSCAAGRATRASRSPAWTPRTPVRQQTIMASDKRSHPGAETPADTSGTTPHQQAAVVLNPINRPRRHLGDVQAGGVDHEVAQEPQLRLEFAVLLEHHLKHGGVVLAAVPAASQWLLTTGPTKPAGCSQQTSGVSHRAAGQRRLTQRL